MDGVVDEDEDAREGARVRAAVEDDREEQDHARDGRSNYGFPNLY